jgi:glycine cleavage system aminomethyltransferase T
MMDSPIAAGPLSPAHRRAGATIEVVAGWETAVRYPSEPAQTADAVVDLTGRIVSEINGPDTSAMLPALCGGDVPIRSIRTTNGRDVYRLTNVRAIVIGGEAVDGGFNVTGGWATIGLYGPHAAATLQKITAIDVRDRSLGIGQCAQGPVFGVNVLFGRFANHYQLHACPDMTQFLWEVLLDAGEEFSLKPAGRKWLG